MHHSGKKRFEPATHLVGVREARVNGGRLRLVGDERLLDSGHSLLVSHGARGQLRQSRMAGASVRAAQMPPWAHRRHLGEKRGTERRLLVVCRAGCGRGAVCARWPCGVQGEVARKPRLARQAGYPSRTHLRLAAAL